MLALLQDAQTEELGVEEAEEQTEEAEGGGQERRSLLSRFMGQLSVCLTMDRPTKKVAVSSRYLISYKDSSSLPPTMIVAHFLLDIWSPQVRSQLHQVS